MPVPATTPAEKDPWDDLELEEQEAVAPPPVRAKKATQPSSAAKKDAGRSGPPAGLLIGVGIASFVVMAGVGYFAVRALTGGEQPGPAAAAQAEPDAVTANAAGRPANAPQVPPVQPNPAPPPAAPALANGELARHAVHNGKVLAVHRTADPDVVLSLGSDGRVVRTKLSTGEKLSEHSIAPPATEDAVPEFRLFPAADGLSFLSIDRNNSKRLVRWEVDEPEPVQEWQTEAAVIASQEQDPGKPPAVTFETHQDSYVWAEMLPDGKSALVSTTSGVQHHDFATGSITGIFSLRGHEEHDPIQDAYIYYKRLHHHASDTDYTLEVSRLSRPHPPNYHLLGGGPVVRLSPSGELAYLSNWLWTTSDWKQIGPAAANYNFVFFPGEQQILDIGQRSLRILDTASGRVQKELHSRLALAEQSISVAVSGDGKRAASGEPDGRIALWDLSGQLQIAVLNGHGQPGTFVALSRDGQQVISGGGDGTIRTWEFAADPAFATAPLVHTQPASAQFRVTALSRDGLYAVAAGTESIGGEQPGGGPPQQVIPVLRSWDLSGDAGGGRRIRMSDGADVQCLAVSPSGALAVTGERNGKITLWNIADGHEEKSLAGDGGISATPIMACEFIGEDKVATGDATGNLVIWECASGESLHTHVQQPSELWRLISSVDGQLLLCVGVGKPYLLNVQSKEVTLLPDVFGPVPILTATLSPDNKTVAVLLLDQTINLVDLASGEIRAKFRHDGRPHISHDNIHMVWSTLDWSQQRGAVLQYSSDGAQLTATYANLVTTWKSDGSSVIAQVFCQGATPAIATEMSRAIAAHPNTGLVVADLQPTADDIARAAHIDDLQPAGPEEQPTDFVVRLADGPVVCGGLSNDGRYAAVAINGGLGQGVGTGDFVLLFDAETRTPVGQVNCPKPHAVRPTESGSHLLVADESGIHLWDVNKQSVVEIRSGLTDAPAAVWSLFGAQSYHGLSLGGTAEDPSARHAFEWDMEALAEIRRDADGPPRSKAAGSRQLKLRGQPHVDRVYLAPNGSRVAMTTIAGSESRVPEAGKRSRRRGSKDQNDEELEEAAPGDSEAAPESRLLIFDLQSNRLMHTLEWTEHAILHAAFSHDRQRIFAIGAPNAEEGLRRRSAAGGQALAIWNADSGELLRTVELSEPVRSCEALPNPDYAVLAGDGLLSLWNLAEARQVMGFSDHRGSVSPPLISADGKRWLTFSEGGAVLYDFTTEVPAAISQAVDTPAE